MPRHKNQDNFDPDTKTKYFSTPAQNQVSSDPYTEIKPISTTHTTKSISFLRWNQVKFHPPDWDQVNFNHPH